MQTQASIRRRNRLISLIPAISGMSELRHLWKASRVWHRQGWTSPPPYFIRRAMLLEAAAAIDARIFVETGTFLGDTTWAFRNRFDEIHTIEVEPSLAQLARERFKGFPSIRPVEGDSAICLAEICEGLKAPTLFFLDGHYSGGFTGMGSQECPIIEELSAIFRHSRIPFRIVIDDARLFGTDSAYPTLDKLRDHLLILGWGGQIKVENDAIFIE